MAEQIYYDSNYRFSDPVRFFKANDPYYFEVDNIPLKQLQENCLWLKDQVRKDSTKLLGVKRADLDELRPYATGADRVLRVKPGRYTARINDASTKTPLAYLEKVIGEAVGDVDAWATALPNPGGFPNQKNAILQAALDTFKQSISQEAMGMTGLAERAFTWPIVNSDTPIDNDGVDLVGTEMSYGGYDVNIPGGGADYSPMLVTQALIWAKSQGSTDDSYVLPSFETTDPTNGWAKFPRTESYFIKRWRGVSRLAIVDVDDEISIEVPQFDPDDFAYTNSEGTTTQVEGVQSRIDLVFIYSKPVDSSGVTILKPSGKVGITKPTLGIVRGAGIKTNFQESSQTNKDYITNLDDDHGILAHPGDQKNINMGFTATSGNDLLQDIRGSFPAPDDILNIAPLISERLEDNAYELVGQSILPVAYVWVQNGSQVVLSTDVIDIRPIFRTAELAYNERAGIGAAFPQLSLANPAVGKGQLDYEIKRAYDDIKGQIENLGDDGATAGTGTLATGYVFGGWHFGPEGALYDFYQQQNSSNNDPDDDSDVAIKEEVTNRYGFGAAADQVTIPSFPDWDLSQWCIEQDLSNKGFYPNDYLNTFISAAFQDNAAGGDPSVVCGSRRWELSDNPDYSLARLTSLSNFVHNFGNSQGGGLVSTVNFMYVAKKIKFNRPSWLADYKVDIDLINCVPEVGRGTLPIVGSAGSYIGHWVEKGFSDFTIYVSFVADSNNHNSTPAHPAPYMKDGILFSDRGEAGSNGGERFAGFAVLTKDILLSNTAPILSYEPGYVGNPRMGKCTYPTVMWNMVGIPNEEAAYLYGNLNNTDPTITLKGS